MSTTDQKVDLKILGKQTPLPKHPDEATLEVIPNRWPDADYEVTLRSDEFTAICPITGQPDFATIIIHYVPDKRLIESKALKLYLGAYRNVGIFHEFAVNKICHDLAKAMHPKKIEVRGEFSVRGGISIHPVARWKQEQGSITPVQK